MEFVYETLKRTLSNKVIARTFQMNFEVIRHVLKHSYSISNHYDKHPKHSNEIERELLDWIRENADNKKVFNRT